MGQHVKRYAGICSWRLCRKPFYSAKPSKFCPGGRCYSRAWEEAHPRVKRRPRRPPAPRSWRLADKALVPLRYLSLNSRAIDRALAAGEPVPGVVLAPPAEP